MADDKTEKTEQKPERNERPKDERPAAVGGTAPSTQTQKAEATSLGADEPVIVKTVLAGVNEDTDEARPQTIVNANDGEELEAPGNGLPYEGVSENWVQLKPED